MKIDGNWTAMELSGLGDVWSQQNSLDQQIDMLNQSRLTLVGSEMRRGLPEEVRREDRGDKAGGKDVRLRLPRPGDGKGFM